MQVGQPGVGGRPCWQRGQQRLFAELQRALAHRLGPPAEPPLTRRLPAALLPTRLPAARFPQSEDEVRNVVREAQGSIRVIDVDNIDEMADDILAEEEADDLLEGGCRGCTVVSACW